MEPENSPALPIIYMPALHPELVTTHHNLPEGVQFLSCGLASTGSEAFFVPDMLPFDAVQSAACLNDLLVFSSQFSHARELASVSFSDSLSEEEQREERLRNEFAAIFRFEESGEHSNSVTQNSVPSSKDDSGISAQKTLLLAWELERRVAELSTLEAQFAGKQEAFSQAVGLLDEDSLEDLQTLEAVEGKRVLGAGAFATQMAWRSIFMAALRFVPNFVQWLSLDTELTAAIRECGTKVSVQAPAGFEGWSAPAWKMLGHTRPPQGFSWLERDIVIFLAVEC